jgi:four helix bundle protein
MAKSYQLRKRTYDFAIDIVRLCRTYPQTLEGRIFCEQLIRAGTSVAANYRGACRGRSSREFIAKVGTVIEEADESEFWLSATRDLEIVSSPNVEILRAEADELVAIFTQSLQTARQSLKNPRPRT